MGKNGFTIIEFVLVIVIIAILNIFLLFSWEGASLNLEAQAQQICNDIRFAQSLAMSTGQRYRWVKASSSTYQIVNNAGTAITLAQGSTTVTLGTGITFSTFTNLPNNLIAFDGKGQPYINTTTPGTLLSSTASLLITAGGQTATIIVSPETGRVIVQ